MQEKPYNYVYEIRYPNGMKYIGVRSSYDIPEQDSYLGSGFHIPEHLKTKGKKYILSNWPTRKAAMLEEIRLHAFYNVKDNPDFYNQCNSTTTKFIVSEDAHKRGAMKRLGRTKDTHEYIRKQVQARSKYKGNNRTEAQKAQFSPENMPIRMQKYHATFSKNMEDPIFKARVQDARVRGGKSCKGIKNPKKAHIGNKHPKAFKWWFKAPQHENITFVDDSVRNYWKHNKQLFPFSAASIMRFLRDNRVPDRLKEQGWQFGKVTVED